MFVPVLLLIASLAISSALNATAGLGIDVSQPLSTSTASCLIDQGYGSILIARGYMKSGAPDTNYCGTITNAKAGGYSEVAVYIFPCPTCGPAADQIQQLATELSKCDAANGEDFKIWLDVEGTQYWLQDYAKNQAWYKDFVDACQGLMGSNSCGVYASKSQWEGLFGTSEFVYGSDLGLPLWYAHYDNDPSFDDYPKYSFGGWDKPWAKQYFGDASVCDFNVDLNYAPYA
tara:strand:+ start:112 stop:804 length:693 start_codon:yes stop_codon:yes gene_type:complete